MKMKYEERMCLASRYLLAARQLKTINTPLLSYRNVDEVEICFEELFCKSIPNNIFLKRFLSCFIPFQAGYLEIAFGIGFLTRFMKISLKVIEKDLKDDDNSSYKVNELHCFIGFKECIFKNDAENEIINCLGDRFLMKIYVDYMIDIELISCLDKEKYLGLDTMPILAVMAERMFDKAPDDLKVKYGIKKYLNTISNSSQISLSLN